MKQKTRSAILLVLMLLQFVSTVLYGMGYGDKHLFTLEHEDTIFIMFLCTWFIVSAIDAKEIR